MDVRTLILTLRPDLCRRFGFDQPERARHYLAWLVTSGTREYTALTEDPTFRALLSGRDEGARLTRLQQLLWDARTDVQRVYALPQDLRAYVHWWLMHGVGEHALWPFLTTAEKRMVVRAPGPWQSQFLMRGVQELAADALPSWHQRPFGVNLIGYAYGQLGIGEDVRMAARAMQAAKVPFALLDFPPGREVPQNDRSMAAFVSETGPYAFNIFCMTALEHGRYYAERGAAAQMQGRYNIGYWPWELSRWPPQWADLVQLVDEVWVSTRHTLQAVAEAVAALARPVPVRLMPMAVELGPVQGARAQVRKRFGLPARAKLFVFAFDLNSSIHRKNPQAVVDAFLRAFPASQWSREQVGLVIRTGHPKRATPIWERLKALAAADGRLHLAEGTLQRPQLLALYRACDAFVSLHRAEGFGRGIAEALQLGLHVITTGYSGNVDFCAHPALQAQVDFVRYRLVKVLPGQYPFGHGQVWANADLAHAAQCMRQFAQQTARYSVPEGGWPMFSGAVVGRQYQQRLQQIWRGRRPALRFS